MWRAVCDIHMQQELNSMEAWTVGFGPIYQAGLCASPNSVTMRISLCGRTLFCENLISIISIVRTLCAGKSCEDSSVWCFQHNCKMEWWVTQEKHYCIQRMRLSATHSIIIIIFHAGHQMSPWCYSWFITDLTTDPACILKQSLFF